MITIVPPQGCEFKARALVDQGSQLSFVTESLAQQLRLPRQHSSISFLGIGAHKYLTTRGSLSLCFSNHCDSSIYFNVEAHILTKISGRIPSSAVTLQDVNHLSQHDLVDPSFASPGFVDVLRGANIYGQLLREELRQGDPSSPTAQRTALGWIVSGPVPATSAYLPNTSSSLFHVLSDGLNELVHEFWAQEVVAPTKEVPMSEEDDFCEQHFVSTHSRDGNGRYMVRLPFKSTPPNFGDSRFIATKMLANLRRRFAQDPTLCTMYTDFLDEYEELGHMDRISDLAITENAYYRPHHGVLRESSTTTKLRVVYNGSQKTSCGVSLNDILHAGPKLQQDLFDVLIRWRLYAYVFASDIEKMYRQIKVHPEDQSILWNKDHRADPFTFQLSTVTYGLKSAPFLAIRVLRQLASDDGHLYPLAAEVIRQNVYVDDVLAGADSISLAIQKIRQVDQLFSAGGFRLQKWVSNDEAALSPIDPSRKLPVMKTFEGRSTLRALGLGWDPVSDVFIFTFDESIFKMKATTKRAVLSLIARLFDPLGCMAPVVILAKVVLQTLWTTPNLQWDDPLPDSLAERWNEFAVELASSPSLSIPRWLGTQQSSVVELHGFSDASKAALAAVIYVRVVGDDSSPARSSLLVSKTKVAPLKRVTIARLELSAAVLLSQLVTQVYHCLGLSAAPIHLWTDSTVALTWISGHPSRWKEFVGNRVQLIHELVPCATWHHVAGADNPADIASRGLLPRQLQEQQSWWNGPTWLGQSFPSWPKSSSPLDDSVNLEEQPPIVHMATSSPELWNLLDRYSTLDRLLRVTARVMEAAALFRRPRSNTAGASSVLTAAQLDKALLFWVKQTQNTHFTHEADLLSQGKQLTRSSPLVRLTPFLDDEGLYSALAGGCSSHLWTPTSSTL